MNLSTSFSMIFPIFSFLVTGGTKETLHTTRASENKKYGGWESTLIEKADRHGGSSEGYGTDLNGLRDYHINMSLGNNVYVEREW